MFIRKRVIFVLAVLALVVALASATSAGAAGPVINVTTHETTPVGPDNFCGIDGVSYTTYTDHLFTDASGNTIENNHNQTFFTANGKTIVAFSSSTERTTTTDNGDGTITVTSTETGQLLHFQILNGPIFQSTEPIRSAGFLTTTVVLDAVTGDLISSTSSFAGPHLFREGVDVCGPVITYLMDP
jgi:hypothetical protein